MTGSFFTALIENPFLQTAFFAGILASITSGIVGSYIVVKRIVFLAGSIAHSVLSGMGICLYLRYTYQLEWLQPIYGAFVSGILSAILIGWIHLRFKQREDSVIAAIWSSGMAIGVIFISITPATTTDLLNFLFGNILWVTTSDLYLLSFFALLILGVVSLYYNRFLAVCFDETQSLLRGLNTKSYSLSLLSLIALSVVLLIKVVGIVLVIALLSIPPTIASMFSSRLNRVMILSVIVSIATHFIGLMISYQANFPSGASIALTAAIFYAGALGLKKVF